VFRNDEDIARGEGHFVHVFVERGAQRRPFRKSHVPSCNFCSLRSTN